MPLPGAPHRHCWHSSVWRLLTRPAVCQSMQIVLDCGSSHAGWLLVPLLAVLATLSSRHRVNRPRLAASCFALCVAAFVVSSCHTGSTATRSPASSVAKLDTAKAAAEEALVQSLLQVSAPCCLPAQPVAAALAVPVAHAVPCC